MVGLPPHTARAHLTLALTLTLTLTLTLRNPNQMGLPTHPARAHLTLALTLSLTLTLTLTLTRWVYLLILLVLICAFRLLAILALAKRAEAFF